MIVFHFYDDKKYVCLPYFKKTGKNCFLHSVVFLLRIDQQRGDLMA